MIIELKAGEAYISFKDFDPDNPPPEGHYIVLCKDKKMQMDFISKNGYWGMSLLWGTEVVAYAKIKFVMENNFEKN